MIRDVTVLLRNLITMLSFRGIGNTTLMRRGVDATPTCLVLVKQHKGSDPLGIPKDKVVTLEQASRLFFLVGRHYAPLAIDHAALAEILTAALDRILELERALADEITSKARDDRANRIAALLKTAQVMSDIARTCEKVNADLVVKAEAIAAEA